MRLILFLGVPLTASAAWMAAGCSMTMPMPSDGRIAIDRVPIRYGKGAVPAASFPITVAEWSEIAALFAPEPLTPEAERAAAAQAIARFESVAAAHTPTGEDRGGSNHPRLRSVGQMDCIDESTNTTIYLLLLQQEGLLRHHEVMRPTQRFRFFVDAHRTAVLRERATGELYAVDSWFLDNGHPAVVLPLAVWVSGREDPEMPRHEDEVVE